MAAVIDNVSRKQERAGDIYRCKNTQSEGYVRNTFWLSLNFMGWAKVKALCERLTAEMAVRLGNPFIELEIENLKRQAARLMEIKARIQNDPNWKEDSPGTKPLVRFRMTFMDQPGNKGEVGFAYFDQTGTNNIRAEMGNRLAQMEREWATMTLESHGNQPTIATPPTAPVFSPEVQQPVQQFPQTGKVAFMLNLGEKKPARTDNYILEVAGSRPGECMLVHPDGRPVTGEEASAPRPGIPEPSVAELMAFVQQQNAAAAALMAEVRALREAAAAKLAVRRRKARAETPAAS